MTQETIEKIEKLEKAINSPATPENIKETMRKALEVLKSEKVEAVTEVTPYKTYSTIKSCLLDDGDDSDDYIYEGKLIHNVEALPKDTWEIVEFYNYGVVLKHIPTSVLADSKPNKNVSLDELKVLFASDKIEIDGIEKGNTKVFNLCIKAIIKCIDSLDMASYKENLLAELNASKTELEKTIEASNLLESEKNAILSEKSNLEKESAEKIQTLESDIAAKSISMEEAKAIQEAETLRLKKQLEDLDALNSMRTLIDMLTEDIAKKDFKETPSIESNEKIKVKEIRLFAAEGKVSGYGFPKVVNTYEEANDAVMPVYEDAIESSYANKCRFTVTFEDGETYNGDLFVGAKYDNPTKGNVIGKHIKDYLESEIKENRQSEETKKEIREFLEKYDLGFDEKNLVIKDWYTKNYPSDDLGQKLNNDNTFNDMWNAIHSGIDVYSVLGVSDSIVRERVFEKLSEINGVEYDYVYNKWLNNDEYSNGGAVKGVRENIVLKANEILGVDSSFHFISDNEFTIEPMSEDEKFNGMALNSFPDGTYEVAEFLAGEDGKDLYIFGNYKSLVPALKSLSLGNSSTGRKPIKVEKFENGGEIYPDDKVIITTSSLGKKYQGMKGTVNDRKLTGDDMYSIKLEDGMEMAFHKDEFRHNSINPRWQNN